MNDANIIEWVIHIFDILINPFFYVPTLTAGIILFIQRSQARKKKYMGDTTPVTPTDEPTEEVK